MKSSTYLRLLIISIVIAVAIFLINYVFFMDTITVKDAFIIIGINFLFAASLTISNHTYFNYLNRFFSWNKQPLTRVIVGAVGSIIITMVILALVNALVYIGIYDNTVDEFIASQNIEWYYFGLIITLIISLIFHAVYFYKELQAKKVKDSRVEARSATAQLDALKNQLDPHFLFNSLNVLVSLIEENPKAAVNFTTSLSKVYRYVLEQRNKELISVEEELKFATTYIKLLKTRFEDSLKVTLPATVDKNMMVVPLSLQLLLENAVKHNVISDRNPLRISIYIKDNILTVKNNLQIKKVMAASSGVGLKNIESRYMLLTHKTMTIKKTDHEFSVSIPIIDRYETETINHHPVAVNTLSANKESQVLKKVKSIKEFYNDILKLGLISLLLVAINIYTGGIPWALFPIVAMSGGLFFQWLRLKDRHIILGNDWEQRRIEKLLTKNKIMESSTDYQTRYNNAQARVGEIRSFYNHLAVYIIINALLAGFNYYQNEWRIAWFIFPLAGWGIGLLGHGLSTYGTNPFTGKDWEQRKIKELMDKDKAV